MNAAPALSVVVACTSRRGALPAAVDEPAWLSALRESCAGVDAEYVLVGAAPAAGASDPACVVVPAPDGSLVPVRWELGLLAARGTVVAFTTDLCAVSRGWATAAIAAIARGATAVGGPISPGANLTRVGQAIYQLRFGALPPRVTGCTEVQDVAADNAAYRRATLLAIGGALARGFWEVECNHRLRAAGHGLVFCGEMRAVFVGGESLRGLVRQRYLHGRQSGRWRVHVGARRTWQVVLATPLVPFVLLARAARRCAASGRATHALHVAPEFLVLAAAWAAGEAVGATAHGRARSTTARDARATSDVIR